MKFMSTICKHKFVSPHQFIALLANNNLKMAKLTGKMIASITPIEWNINPENI